MRTSALTSRFVVPVALSMLVLSCVATDATRDAPRLALTTPHPQRAPMTGPLDASFTALSDRFLAGYLEREPVRATEAGDHRFDGRFPDLSEAGEREGRAFVEKIRADLKQLSRDSLGVQAQVDHQILENILDFWLFAIDELREIEWNPIIVVALIGDGLDPLVTRDFAPAQQRAQSLVSRLAGVPALLDAAKTRLKRPPRVHTETAIAQVKGLIALCDGGLADLEKEVPSEKSNIDREAKKAATALRSFEQFLVNDLLPRSDGDFRLGRDRFTKKLRLVLDDNLDIDRIAADARDLLTLTQDEMVATSQELFPKLFAGEPAPALDTPAARKAFVKKTLAKLAQESSTNATIVHDAETWLTDATKFVRENDLVEVPAEPCKVIEMPEYRRGVAIAYCDASGPLEPKPQTFYAISPTPADWSPERSASFYREYNRSMLADLTIHEAMPGHFLQLMHNNRFTSKLRAVFSSGSFVEGWAVYTEWLMASHGFGGPAVRLQRQKMVLRLSVNALLDHGIHAGTMTEAEGLALMRDEAFQEEGEAVGKWKRARLTSAQLTTYFHGFRDMMMLRKTAEKQPGFRERTYHDRLLSAGSPPMRHTWTLMNLQRPTTSPFTSSSSPGDHR